MMALRQMAETGVLVDASLVWKPGMAEWRRAGDAAELARLIVGRRVAKETYIWTPGMADWGLAEAVPDVLQLVALTPPPVPDAG